MRDRLRLAVAPVYVLLSLFLGGSTQGELPNLALQLLGIGIIAWAMIERRLFSFSGPQSHLFLISALTVLLFAVQLVPLPPGIWSALPGREPIVQGFQLLGRPLPWMPISLAPYDSLATALTLIPPLAVLAAMLSLRAYRTSWLYAAILAGTFAGVMLGAVQVGAGQAASPWYLYPRTNFGAAVGFFANSNHMGALLLVALALIVGLIVHVYRRPSESRARSAVPVLAVAAFLVFGVGVLLNGSLAVLLLGLPVALASVAMAVPRQGSLRKSVLLGGGAVLVALMALYASPVSRQLAAANESPFASRAQIWSTSLQALSNHALIGSGLGTFEEVYPLYQDPAMVRKSITNHAHNDYIELAMEGGLPAILLMGWFIMWWFSRAIAVWRPQEPDVYAQAAVIASGTLLLHSLVDFPLRMTALSTVMAACVAIIAVPRGRGKGDRKELWPTRHVRI